MNTSTRAACLVAAIALATASCTPLQSGDAESDSGDDQSPQASISTTVSSDDSDTATAADGSAAAPGGELAVFVSSDPGGLDPALLNTYDQNLISTNILEGLYRLTPDGTQIEPALAEDAQMSEDGLTWTITLRNATFHDGTPVTAQDVKFSFERLASPDLQSPKASLLDGIVGTAEARSGDANEISGITVQDDQTVEFELTDPSSAFESLLASPNLAVVSDEAVQSLGDDFATQVVSAGPFTLSEWNANESIVATSFDNYWDGAPSLDSVTWRVIPDENTRMVEFEAGQLDITWLPPAQYSQYADDPEWDDHVHRAPTIHTEFFSMNMERAPLGDSHDLRAAICSSVDREAVVASLQGRATVAEGLLPTAFEVPVPSGECQMNQQDASSAVESTGIGEPLTLIAPPWGNLTSTLQLYQDNLATIGLDVEIEALEFAQYQERLVAGDYDLAWHYRVPDYLDAGNYLQPLLESDQIEAGNVARFSSDEMDQLLEQAAQATDAQARTQALAEAEQLVGDELPYIPLTHNIYVDISSQRVQGYTPSAMDTHNYRDVSMTN